MSLSTSDEDFQHRAMVVEICREIGKSALEELMYLARVCHVDQEKIDGKPLRFLQYLEDRAHIRPGDLTYLIVLLRNARMMRVCQLVERLLVDHGYNDVDQAWSSSSAELVDHSYNYINHTEIEKVVEKIEDDDEDIYVDGPTVMQATVRRTQVAMMKESVVVNEDIQEEEEEEGEDIYDEIRHDYVNAGVMRAVATATQCCQTETTVHGGRMKKEKRQKKRKKGIKVFGYRVVMK